VRPTAPAASLFARTQRRLLLDTLESPSRFRWSARAGQLASRVTALIPSSLRPMLSLLPSELPAPVTLPPLTPAVGPRRARVALLAGCAQQVLAPAINVATLRVLAANGVEVIVPP
jgi:glycolate oxidase iron-sulfur subunit